MKLKIPPVVVVFVSGIVMWGINELTKEALSYAFDQQRLISMVFFILCVICVVTGLYAFFKLKTTVDPMKPEEATKLVTIGIYHLSRNPMYLGMFLLLTGFGVKLGNPLNILPLFFFIWFMTRFQIKPEEEALNAKFGSPYQEYCRKVRRWV